MPFEWWLQERELEQSSSALISLGYYNHFLWMAYLIIVSFVYCGQMLCHLFDQRNKNLRDGISDPISSENQVILTRPMKLSLTLCPRTIGSISSTVVHSKQARTSHGSK